MSQGSTPTKCAMCQHWHSYWQGMATAVNGICMKRRYPDRETKEGFSCEKFELDPRRLARGGEK